MTESDIQHSDGLVILALRIRDVDTRRLAVHRLVNMSAERVTGTLFELGTADWDEGLWEEEVERLREILEGTRDTIIIWRFDNDRFTRFTIEG